MKFSSGEVQQSHGGCQTVCPPLKIYLAYRPVPALKEKIHPVSLTLRSLGHEVVQIDDQAIELHELQPNCVLWIMDNANWFPRLMSAVGTLPQQRRPLVVIWHWEPLPHPTVAGSPAPRLSLREWAKIILRDPRATDLYTNHRRIAQLARQGIPDVLAVCSFAWHEFLQECGIQSVWVPIGRDREDGEDLGLNRDLDALFLGSLEIPRRKQILNYLRKQNVDVHAKGSWFDGCYWGNRRTELINRAVTFLNIQRYPGEFAGHRLILGMTNKSLVISEPIYKPLPFESGKHYVSATVQEMPAAIEHYLHHPDERQEIVDAAYNFLTSEVTMAQSVARILLIIQQRFQQRKGVRYQ